jgi:rubrerythrin
MIQSGSEQTNERLFELAIEIEHRAANFYQAFLIMFSDVPGLDDFWQVLINDELGHERMLKETRKSLSAAQLQAPADEKIWRGLARIQRWFTDDLPESVRTLDDAYDLAYQFEYSEINAIFEFLESEWIPSEKRNEIVHSIIEKHLNTLLSFSDRFGEKDWRRSINKKIISG